MKKFVFVCIAFFSLFLAKATHNRAGEITYRHLTGLTYEVSVTIFADPNSPAIARKEIEVDWGDNTKRDSLNVSQEFNVVPGFIRKRIWTAQHTFPGPGNYSISVTDPNRNGGVDNINNSSAVPFYVASLLRILPIGGVFNSSPELLNDPIDDACVGQPFVHNPGAIDLEGDSLAYAISPSYGIGGAVAPGYTFPPTSNQLYVDPITGDLRWENPSQIGTYNIAIRILEYRNGVLIGDVLRDMQIVVFPGCNNIPPRIAVNRENCIEAGRTLNMPVQGIDQNLGDLVQLSFTGEIFESIVPNQAVVNFGPVSNPTNASVIWNTICDNIRPETYSLSIKATDNGSVRGSTDLSAFENASIRVVGPAVNNFTATTQGKNIELNWNTSNCSNAVGYIIYRRLDSSGFTPSDCQIGVPNGIGYEEIFRSNDPNLVSYTDNNEGIGMVPGQRYCYLITARFPGGDEGYASVETCAEISKVVPVMTQVSVESTDVNTGELSLAWSPPDSIDATAFPAPYRYLLYQKSSNQYELIDSTSSLVDTTYTLSNQNTEASGMDFQVELYSLGAGRSLLAKTAEASSVFLSAAPLDKRLLLTWEVNVPWTNDSFIVYRYNELSMQFDSIGISLDQQYEDVGLSNGRSYCYYVESFGAYNLTSVQKPLRNKSQELCAVPEDLEPPCTPELVAQASCESNTLTLSWNNPNLNCPTGDAISYEIYRAPTIALEYQLLDTIANINQLTYTTELESIAGCYAIASVDSSGNRSALSAAACVDYCPIYELPNIYTPNGDGINDLFVPIENPRFRYVESIDLKVYNRWNQLVFETTKPEINWNGKHSIEGTLVPDGIYFYTCIVNELTLTGTQPRLLKGTITLIDGQSTNFE